MTTTTRRGFLATTGAGLALATLSRPAFAQAAEIRHFWWGNPERDKRTFAVIDVFNGKHPDIKVTGETVGFPDYFPKLTTQIAGGNMPDVIQMGYGVIREYIDKGAIVALEDFVGKSLDVSQMDKSALDAGTFGGKLMAISIGANSHMAVWNSVQFAKAGIEPGKGWDPLAWTYDDLKRIGVEVAKANEGKGGLDDATANYQIFSDFVTQNGVSMFAEDGAFQVPQELVEEYWNMWTAIRDAGATPAGKVSAGLVTAQMADLGVVKGDTAMSYVWSNQLVGAQGLIQDKLGAAMYPNTAKMVPGSVIQPSQFVCLTRDAKSPEAAAAYMSAFVNDPDMTDVLGLERGIPANAAARAALADKLSEAERASVAFFDAIQGKTAPLPPPPPSGANEIEQTFQRLATGVLLNQDTIADSAANYVRQSNFIRKRSG
jgi:multiple sugar transport system substrate-binding protein